MAFDHFYLVQQRTPIQSHINMIKVIYWHDSQYEWKRSVCSE